MTDAQKALSYAEGFLTALAAVLQDREYTDGKVGNITMTTAEVKKMLRSVMTHIGCDANELKGLREENKLLTAQIEEMRQVVSERTERIANWINDGAVPTDNPGEYVATWKCSNCGNIITTKTAYCPGCGARMEVQSTEAHLSDDENKPHKVSMVVCLNCGKRWVAVRPLGTRLTDLECPQCHTQGAATETGEELEDDGK